MGTLQSEWEHSPGRRAAIRALAALAAGTPLIDAQQDIVRDHSRVPRLDELLSAADYEAVAHAKLPRTAYDYTAYGSNGEFTLRRNREAFDWVQLVPNAMGATPNLATEVLGFKLAHPILISPSAGHVALHPDAESATYQGATAAGTPLIVSNVSSQSYEKIATAAKGPLWFQIYPKPEMDANRELLDTVQTAGCQAVVVTIDQQASFFERAQHGRNLVASPVRRSTRAGATPPNPYRVERTRMWYEWKMLDQLRSMIKGPMLAKGILTAEDAKICLDHGVDAVYVSNHGGRSLDYGPSTLEVLPEIVDAVGKRVPVFFDSGLRGGTDILKALALGANAVCLGRVPRWGLAAYGAPGVQRVLELMQSQLRQAMVRTGQATIAGMGRALARTDFP